MPWWERIDPMSEVKWIDTVRSTWESVHAKRHYLGLHADGSIRQMTDKLYSPITRSPKMLHNYRAVRIMALLNEWQQLTTLQLATMLGESRRASWNTLSNLYDAGILMRLIPKWWEDGVNAEDSGSGSVWRIDRKAWPTKKWFEDLDNQEWALVTNSQDPFTYGIGETTPTALRHNLMTADMVIKAMEAIPGIVGAWGESHLEAGNLYDLGSYETDQVRKNVGDAALITASGKIIVIETSGSGAMNSGSTNSNKIVEKAAAWVSICGRSDLDLYVVFVEAATNPNLDKFMRNVKYGVEDVSSRYVSRKAYRDRGKDRVFAVDGREWFPIARAVSQSFVNLTVQDPRTGKLVNLIDESDSVPNPDSDTVVNTLASIHTPWWITRGITESNNE